jgi:hypothetical protein
VTTMPHPLGGLHLIVQKLYTLNLI